MEMACKESLEEVKNNLKNWKETLDHREALTKTFTFSFSTTTATTTSTAINPLIRLRKKLF